MDSMRPDAALPPLERIRRTVRTVPDWPEPGVMFRDITPLLADA
ncbi:MAG TPA: adenine phosphoribosyltransferase, partial [Burkholderiaceae bacterium]|nr:adenine phosphoribosyltransferase [Burkholderiaceae bacterium]